MIDFFQAPFRWRNAVARRASLFIYLPVYLTAVVPIIVLLSSVLFLSALVRDTVREIKESWRGPLV